MKENCLFFILIILIIFGCIFVKKEDQIREAFGGFKEGFREGQTINYKSVAGGTRPAANVGVWKNFMTRARPGRGYCQRNVTSLRNFNNASVCPAGVNRNISRHIRINFTEPQGRQWNVQVGVDAGNGGFVELDGSRVVTYNADQWGGGQPQNSRLQFTANVSAGNHVMDIHYGEGCCDGRGNIRFRRSNRTTGGGWAGWQWMDTATLGALSRQYRPPRPRPPPPPPPPPAAGSSAPGSCVTRDVVRVNGVWRNCCVRCKSPRYTALSTIGDGGRCLSCGIAPPPPPPRRCSSFSCPCGFINNGQQLCANNNCTQTQCCSKIPKETIPNCISQLSWGRNCAKCDPQGWELSTVPKNAPRKEPPPPTPQPTCGSKTVPSPPPPDCFKQVAPDCKKIPMVPIKDCKKQRDWGKSCITCEVGYKMSSDKTRCDLIPIPFCKKQEREVCLECEESYRIGPTGRTCEKIPKKDIPFCTNQRDWGAYCYECGSDQSGYMVSKNKEKCIPRPISNCKDQEGIRCNKCKFGYERSDNWKSCDIVPIKDCASQNKSICVECKQGYRLGEDRRKCDLLPIENCRERYEEFRTLGGFGKSRLFSNIS